MDNTMEHDKCLTDARQSMRPCRVVLEKIDLDNYNLKKKNNSRKAPERSAEMVKWRRSVIQKRNRLRGYVHTPEEYEQRRIYSQMRQKNFTPEQRARMNARSALFKRLLRERQLRRIQSLSPEDMKKELERIRELNRIKKKRRMQRDLALTEEEREAKKTAARLAYKKNRELNKERYELEKARIRDRCIARQMLRYVTEQNSIHGSDSLTEEQREIYRAKLMLKYVTAKESGQNRVYWGDCLTDEQRERKNAKSRLRYRAKVILNNGPPKKIRPENIRWKYTMSDEQREWKNARDRARRKAIRTAIENGDNGISYPYSLTGEQRERKRAQIRERAKLMLKNGMGQENIRRPMNVEQRESIKLRNRERYQAKEKRILTDEQRAQNRERAKLMLKNGMRQENIRRPLTVEQRERIKLRNRERYLAKGRRKLTDEQRAQNRERAKLMLKNGTEQENIRQPMTAEQRERYNARSRERYQAKGKRILTDEQRDRNNSLAREKRKAKRIPENRTEQDEEERERYNAQRREKYHAKKKLKDETAQDDENHKIRLREKYHAKKMLNNYEEHRKRRNLKRRERYAKSILKNKTAKEIDEDSIDETEPTVKNEQ